MDENRQEIKLTEYAQNGGCSCKIAPTMLEEMLHTNMPQQFGQLLVGNSSKDDAAVYDIGNGNSLIATTDFFTPIVNDPYDFGRIAAANAISDVYAMGGHPIMAIAILGWPIEKIPASAAQQVLEGARSICAEVGIPLAGGHSIITSEPLFGLAVNGLCEVKNLKRNNTAKEGDLLFLTKPIGTGVLSAALKRGLLTKEHEDVLITQLTQINKIGEELSKISGVTAMTDVTGFGLAGHLVEMVEGSGLSVELSYSNIQIANGVKDYLAQRIVPDATYRNWNGYSSKISFEAGVDVMEAFSLLPDPQTNGGLLIAVTVEAKDEVINLMKQNGLQQFGQSIGKLVHRGEKIIIVKQ